MGQKGELIARGRPLPVISSAGRFWDSFRADPVPMDGIRQPECGREPAARSGCHRRPQPLTASPRVRGSIPRGPQSPRVSASAFACPMPHPRPRGRRDDGHDRRPVSCLDRRFRRAGPGLARVAPRCSASGNPSGRRRGRRGCCDPPAFARGRPGPSDDDDRAVRVQDALQAHRAQAGAGDRPAAAVPHHEQICTGGLVEQYLRAGCPARPASPRARSPRCLRRPGRLRRPSPGSPARPPRPVAPVDHWTAQR